LEPGRKLEARDAVHVPTAADSFKYIRPSAARMGCEKQKTFEILQPNIKHKSKAETGHDTRHTTHDTRHTTHNIEATTSRL
jgi:hypothetical protein